MNQNTLDNWNELLKGEFLKADKQNNKKTTYEVLDIEISTDNQNNKPQLILHIKEDHNNNPKAWKFGCNTTNTKEIKKATTKPSDITHKKITLEKIRVYNPTLKQECNGLRITNITT